MEQFGDLKKSVKIDQKLLGTPFPLSIIVVNCVISLPMLSLVLTLALGGWWLWPLPFPELPEEKPSLRRNAVSFQSSPDK